MPWWRRVFPRSGPDQVRLAHTFHTRDGHGLQVDGTIRYRTRTTPRSRQAPGNPEVAFEQLAVTTLRTAVGELDDAEAARSRARLEATVAHVLSEVMDGWGLADVTVTIERVAPARTDPDPERT